MKIDLYIEFNDRKTDQKELVERAKEVWKEAGNMIKDMKQLELYFKPEECKCYYVINNEIKGSFDA